MHMKHNVNTQNSAFFRSLVRFRLSLVSRIAQRLLATSCHSHCRSPVHISCIIRPRLRCSGAVSLSISLLFLRLFLPLLLLLSADNPEGWINDDEWISDAEELGLQQQQLLLLDHGGQLSVVVPPLHVLEDHGRHYTCPGSQQIQVHFADIQTPIGGTCCRTTSES